MNKINNIKELKELIDLFDSETEINLLIYGLSNVELYKAVDSNNLKVKLDELESSNIIPFNEIIELRIFNPQKELFLHKYEGRSSQDNNDWFIYNMTDHSNNDDRIKRTYTLESKFLKKEYQYKEIRVLEYVDYEDNLAYVKKTCLEDIVRG